MDITTSKPFRIIYSLFEHEYLGYLFESFIVQLDDKNRLSFTHQNISAQNASDFHIEKGSLDYQLIEIIDSMQAEAVVRKFHRSYMKPGLYFEKIAKDKPENKYIREEISNYTERRRAQVLSLLQEHERELYIMGSDGNPAWKRAQIQQEKARVIFHFRRNEDNTHYFPRIKFEGEHLDFRYQNAKLICKQPAWLLMNGKVYAFKGDVDGRKLVPFLNKKFILIKKEIEERYYKGFVASLIASFDVYAKGFEIKVVRKKPTAKLKISKLESGSGQSDLFEGKKEDAKPEDDKILFELRFNYDDFKVKPDATHGSSDVKVVKNGDEYIFHKIIRDVEEEKNILIALREGGLPIKNFTYSCKKSDAFDLIGSLNEVFDQYAIEVEQAETEKNSYFLGRSSINIRVNDKIDWFDLEATIKFGEYEYSIADIKKIMHKRNKEIELPNGQIAVIPSSWLRDYGTLFSFLETGEQKGSMRLKKHHFALLEELQNKGKASINSKLLKLREVSGIGESSLPDTFKGELRSYQKAGYNWMSFLNEHHLGGCLADDMGLGKTVQTLALLSDQVHKSNGRASLLVMPTSLLYNWQVEAKRFTPHLRILIHRGTQRATSPSAFDKYDLVLTTYGVARIDADKLKDYRFHYIILDESQAIKNPDSATTQALLTYDANHRLILTGTPVENTTLDLWSQMSFANPGLLGTRQFFQKEFLKPIEQKGDETKIKRLHSMIQPFILRREKKQVATDLPEKVESVKYCEMTDYQRNLYDEVKEEYRDLILQKKKTGEGNKSGLVLLQGLMKLRQIANHPELVKSDGNIEANGSENLSGKINDVMHMLHSIVSKGNKVLIFSQFVKHLNIVKQQLDKEKIAYRYLDGKTTNRQKEVDAFQNDDQYQVFLISLTAGGTGLNLTKAEYVFILDPWWNPAIEAQAIDRAHRIGQTNKVFAYKFITKDTVEEKILDLQERKKELAGSLVTIEESFVKSLKPEEIELLLR
ncbi:MAG: DEAD/DEAH box helicase [Cyclobacteriaceae bacterium]|nr:DEAD/DEAH box helicase [Cyclobacteriaceae bacterium]MCH8514946.1 DEAD/DEAH box helicase [Cyclobacteriaceae bacterium]